MTPIGAFATSSINNTDTILLTDAFNYYYVLLFIHRFASSTDDWQLSLISESVERCNINIISCKLLCSTGWDTITWTVSIGFIEFIVIFTATLFPLGNIHNERKLTCSYCLPPSIAAYQRFVGLVLGISAAPERYSFICWYWAVSLGYSTKLVS